MMSTPAHATALHALPDEAPIDRDAAMIAVGDLLAALGFDPDEGDLAETPRRVADAFIEMTTPEPFEMTTFANEDAYDEPVVVRGIPFVSLCRHHLLPFRGTATVGYVPGDRLVGLSKLARVVAHHARGLQVQESLTVQIARTLETALDPRGVGVVVEAEHLCMSARGVRTDTALTTTTAFRGALAADPALQARFIGARPV
ncbi:MULTISPECIES: GTP cyclohydrolase I [Microbacterium]|uniref:GTP cyclohydrolase I n=1 Tax=Microbacterium TaxID=33882 RepID=UPI001F18D7D1|nr:MULTISPECIES: GTP cyclohydrolase I [Microbacterium]MDR7111360.1 GTP cyclohydrolase I [Microbacterium trichothecenolyticum]MDT0141908.1 GTP cyclohydrolase I [Microbacterium sp. PRC9]